MPNPDSKSIIVWSADWSVATGQAIVTRRVVERQSHFTWIHASYGRGLGSLLGVLSALGRAGSTLLTGQSRTIYVVCSRSTLGFLRDVPALATALAGVRVVVHVHGSDLHQLLTTSPLNRIARLLYDRCEIVVPSTHLIDELSVATRARIHLCENFVPWAPGEVLLAPSVKLNEPLIVWNSNIMASKGVFDLCEAVRLLLPEFPHINVTLLGKPIGDDEMTTDAVSRWLDALLPEPWIDYLGLVSPEQAYRTTAMTDLSVFPSRNDCQPLALIQAMCLGKPIIASDIPSLRATLGDYPAMTIPSPTPNDLAQAIRSVIRNGPPPGLAEAADRARVRFAPDRFDKTMAAIL